MPLDQQPIDDPLMERADAALVASFRVLGQTVQVETNNLLVLNAAQSLLGPEREADTNDKPLNLRLLVHDVPESSEWRPDQQAVFRAHESLFYVAASRSSVIVGDREAKTAFGFISSQQAADLEHLRSAMIQAAVLWIAGGYTLSPVHAAAAEIDGRAVMLRGVAGAGKTTLAFALANQGARLIADDAVFIDRNGDDLVVRGLPWLVYLTPDSARFFPAIPTMPTVTRFNGEEKLVVATRRLPEIEVAERGVLGPTLLVQRTTGNRNELIRLSDQEARDVLTSTSIAVEKSEAQDIDIWSAMIRAGVYRFEMATGPLDAARELIELLSHVDRSQDQM